MRDNRYKEDLDWVENLTQVQKLQINNSMKGICIYHEGSDCNFYGYGAWCYGKCDLFKLKK